MKELKLEVQQIIEGQIRVARDCNMPDYNLATMIRAELELKGWIVYDGYSEIVELRRELNDKERRIDELNILGAFSINEQKKYLDKISQLEAKINGDI